MIGFCLQQTEATPVETPSEPYPVIKDTPSLDTSEKQVRDIKY